MLEVAAPPRFRLGRPPLAQALAQVRFPLVARFETLGGVAPLQDSLQDAFPYMQQQRVQELAMQVGPAGPAFPESSQSIVTEFSSDDGWLLTLGAGSASLSVGRAYEGVESFAERWSDVLSALSKVSSIKRCDRLGVRYLDVVELLPEAEVAWERWFQPELVGLARSELLGGTRLENTLTETRLTRPLGGALEWASAGVQAIVRHGVLPAGSVVSGVPPQEVGQLSFVLDVDIFVPYSQRWNAQLLVSQYRLMHAEIERLFYWSLTDEGKEEFQLQLETVTEGVDS